MDSPARQAKGAWKIVIVGVCIVAAAALTIASTWPFRSHSSPPLVSTKCCRNEAVSFEWIVQTLQPKCTKATGTVALELVDTGLTLTFPCREVLHDKAALEQRAIALVANRHEAAKRARRVHALEVELGVYGDLVRGKRWYPDDVPSLTFDLGIQAAGTNYLCARADDVHFRAQELAYGVWEDGETPVHWLKIEAARIAGECPDRLAAFYSTMRRVGANDAVDTVEQKLPITPT